MKPITKREALQACIDGWLWQAKHLNSVYKSNNPKLQGYRNYCPCCEYHTTHKGEYCNQTCLVPWPGVRCLADESPYYKWKNSETDKEREKYALQIVKLARKALRELKR